MDSNTYNLVTVWIYSISGVVAIFMLSVAIKQLISIKDQLKQGSIQLENTATQISLTTEANKSLATQVKEAVDANKINKLIALLDLEKTINSNRLELSKTSHYINLESNNLNENELDSWNLQLDQCIETYLNSVDRLCFCLLNSYFDDDELRREFRMMINETYETYNPQINKGTHFRNIKKIYEKWSDS